MCSYPEKTGKYAEEMEKIEYTKAALECQYASQSEELVKLKKEIAICKTQKQLLDDQLRVKDAEIAAQQVELEKRDKNIEELDRKLMKAEEDRKRLHNTIQELKGNIRVFCRVRPVKENENGCEPGTQNKIIQFHCSGDFPDVTRFSEMW